MIYGHDPEYSETARQAGFEGSCVLRLTVGADGKPYDIGELNTLGMGLDEKALEAVRQYRFKPAMENGHPVPVQVNVEVNFQIF